MTLIDYYLGSGVTTNDDALKKAFPVYSFVNTRSNVDQFSFVICPMAICYSYGTDKKDKSLKSDKSTVQTHKRLHIWTDRQTEWIRNYTIPYQLNIGNKPRICTMIELLHWDQDFKKVCLQLCRTVQKLINPVSYNRAFVKLSLRR